MQDFKQTYHHITIHSAYIHEQYIVNAPLTVNEMYNFVKVRMDNYASRCETTFDDTISDNPGCPQVISLNTFHKKLLSINGNEPHSLKKKL